MTSKWRSKSRSTRKTARSSPDPGPTVLAGFDPAISRPAMCVPRGITGSSPVMTKAGPMMTTSGHSGPERAPQPIVASTSASAGNRPVAFFEYPSRPSTVISNTPPPLRLNVTAAALCAPRIRSRAARARGSYPHMPQYSISTFMMTSYAAAVRRRRARGTTSWDPASAGGTSSGLASAFNNDSRSAASFRSFSTFNPKMSLT